MPGRAVDIVPDRSVSFFGIEGASGEKRSIQSPRIAVRSAPVAGGDVRGMNLPETNLPVAAVADRLGLSPRRETPEPDLVITIATSRRLPNLDGSCVVEDDRGTLALTANGWACRGAGYHVVVDTASQAAHLTIASGTESGTAPGTDATTAAQTARLAYGLRHTLTSLLPLCGWAPLHGAALAAPSSSAFSASGAPEGILLVGPSGTGKSTLAAGLIRRGWTCASDDLLVVWPDAAAKWPDAEEEDSGAIVTGLSRGVRLLSDARTRLEMTASAGAPVFGSEGKAWHDVPAAAQVKPTCLLVPTITDRDRSRLRPLAPGRAAGAVLEQMHPVRVLPPSDAAATLSAAGRLVQDASVFTLEAGRDLYHDPGRLADLLHAVPA